MEKRNLKDKLLGLLGKLKQRQQRSKKEIFKSLLSAIISVFILCNFAVYSNYLNDKEWKSENQTVNYCMAGALTINTLYLVPLTRTFGINNPVLKPFTFARDSLYKKGLSYIPKDDAERGMWWCRVKFADFGQYYIWGLLNKNENESVKKGKISLYKNYLDEIYSNLINLSQTQKILTNHEIKVKRYGFYVATFITYLNTLIDLSEYENQDKTLISLYKDKKQIQRITYLFNRTANLKTYVEKSESEALKELSIQDSSSTNANYSETLLISSITQLLIGNKLYTNKFICSDPYLKSNYLLARNLLAYLKILRQYVKPKTNFDKSRLTINEAMIQRRLKEEGDFLDLIPSSCNIKIPSLIIKKKEK